MKNYIALALIALTITTAHAHDPSHATGFRKPTPGPGPNGTSNPTFLVHRLGNDHAEGITTLDMNGDGFPDILSGAYWYENPGAQGGDWKQHQFRTVGIHDEFVSDCGEWTIDVNHDGFPDLVTTGWISNGIWWYENPGKSAAPGTLWQKHFITDSYDTEGGAIDGDGHPDLVFAHYNHSGILWISFAGAKPEIHHVGGKEQDGHGIGIADIDGDGKTDILTPYGWFQNIDAAHDKWQWHPDWHLGDAGFPILAYDVNHDGKMDIICPCNQIAKIAGRGTVGFRDCTFVAWRKDRAAIQATAGSVLVSGCEFRQNQPHISLGDRVDRAVITGNLFTGPAQIQNSATKDVQIGLNAAL